jgi:hypothetical protein
MKKLLILLFLSLPTHAEFAVDPQTGETYIINDGFSVNTHTGKTAHGVNDNYTEGSSGDTYRRFNGTIERDSYSDRYDDYEYGYERGWDD